MIKYHSQCGEDKWIVENLNPPKVGFFIDVGASDGIFLSNTYYFEQMGWDGLCFEPNPRSFPKCFGVRKTPIQQCIGLENKKVEFFLDVIEPDLSGIKKHNGTYQKYIVDMYRLDRIIEVYKINKIDLLSIDTEGTEMDVLYSFDILKVRPTTIIIEHSYHRGESPEHREFFKNLPYRLAHLTAANSIYQLNS